MQSIASVWVIFLTFLSLTISHEANAINETTFSVFFYKFEAPSSMCSCVGTDEGCSALFILNSLNVTFTDANSTVKTGYIDGRTENTIESCYGGFSIGFDSILKRENPIRMASSEPWTGAVQLNLELAETANPNSTFIFTINATLDLGGNYTARRNYHSDTDNQTQLDLSLEAHTSSEPIATTSATSTELTATTMALDMTTSMDPPTTNTDTPTTSSATSVPAAAVSNTTTIVIIAVFSAIVVILLLALVLVGMVLGCHIKRSRLLMNDMKPSDESNDYSGMESIKHTRGVVNLEANSPCPPPRETSKAEQGIPAVGEVKSAAVKEPIYKPADTVVAVKGESAATKQPMYKPTDMLIPARKESTAGNITTARPKTADAKSGIKSNDISPPPQIVSNLIRKIESSSTVVEETRISKDLTGSMSRDVPQEKAKPTTSQPPSGKAQKKVAGGKSAEVKTKKPLRPSSEVSSQGSVFGRFQASLHKKVQGRKGNTAHPGGAKAGSRFGLWFPKHAAARRAPSLLEEQSDDVDGYVHVKEPFKKTDSSASRNPTSPSREEGDGYVHVQEPFKKTSSASKADAKGKGNSKEVDGYVHVREPFKTSEETPTKLQPVEEEKPTRDSQGYDVVGFKVRNDENISLQHNVGYGLGQSQPPSGADKDEIFLESNKSYQSLGVKPKGDNISMQPNVLYDINRNSAVIENPAAELETESEEYEYVRRRL